MQTFAFTTMWTLWVVWALFRKLVEFEILKSQRCVIDLSELLFGHWLNLKFCPPPPRSNSCYVACQYVFMYFMLLFQCNLDSTTNHLFWEVNCFVVCSDFGLVVVWLLLFISEQVIDETCFILRTKYDVYSFAHLHLSTKIIHVSIYFVLTGLHADVIFIVTHLWWKCTLLDEVLWENFNSKFHILFVRVKKFCLCKATDQSKKSTNGQWMAVRGGVKAQSNSTCFCTIYCFLLLRGGQFPHAFWHILYFSMFSMFFRRNIRSWISIFSNWMLGKDSESSFLIHLVGCWHVTGSLHDIIFVYPLKCPAPKHEVWITTFVSAQQCQRQMKDDIWWSYISPTRSSSGHFWNIFSQNSSDFPEQ